MDHILVADDQESIRQILAQTLSDKGYQVTTAEDGEAALKIFEANPTGFNLILADINMPRVNGFDFLKRVKDKHAKMPVVFCTSLNEDVVGFVGHEYKVDGIIKKPFVISELLKLVEQTIANTR